MSRPQEQNPSFYLQYIVLIKRIVALPAPANDVGKLATKYPQA